MLSRFDKKSIDDAVEKFSIELAWASYQDMVLPRIKADPRLLELCRMCFFDGAFAVHEATRQINERKSANPIFYAYLMDRLIEKHKAEGDAEDKRRELKAKES